MYKILMQLKTVLLSRLGINLIGFIALCSLVWLIGYLFHLSIVWRLIFIGIVILLFAIGLLLRWIWVKRRGAKLAKQLQVQTESAAGRQMEVKILGEKLNEAINSLKTSELGVKYRGNAALYALPWYMVIGPAAGGKSTLLRNSGLHFPFSSTEDLQIKGFGGTKNCDWWFADEAVVLDTAGRYTTEDNDRGEWLAFLDLLQKNRPHLPINGIIVAVSLADLLTGSADQINWHVKVIRERVEDLYGRLGFIFPVTLLFTKVDLLKGFVEFFGDLSLAERNQIWGVNFAADHGEQLDNLYLKLTQLRLHKLSMERNLQRKYTIYDFPEQFRASLVRVKQLISLLLKTNPYQETPNFCGAYFTSGTQEGAPMQQLIGNLKTAFGVVDAEEENPVIEKKSYFIRELFDKVIIPNKNAIAKTKKRIHLQLWLKSAAVIGCIGVLGLAFLMLITSFTSNIMLLHKGETLAQRLLSDESLGAIEDSYNYYHTLLNYKEDVPWHLRLGLYRGDTQLPIMSEMLAHVLHYKFAMPLHNYLTNQLQNYHKLWQHSDSKTREQLRGDYYAALKSYLMLSFPNHIDADQATKLFTKYWNKMLFGKEANTKQYQGVVHFYVAHATAMPANKGMVQEARHDLYLKNSAKNLYTQLDTIYGNELASVTLDNLLKGHADNLLSSSYQVPGLYTKQGWIKVAQPVIAKIAHAARHKDWVMATPFTLLSSTIDGRNLALNDGKEAEQKLEQEINQLYFADYSRVWLRFLTSVKVQPFGSLDEASKGVTELADTKGELATLLQQVAFNTNIEQLNLEFASLRDIIGKPLTAYFDELKKIPADLQQLTASSNAGRDAENYAARLLSGTGGNSELYRSMVAVNTVVNPINSVATRRAMQKLLLQPIRETWRVVLHTATEELNSIWKAHIVSDYQQNIAHHFPFDRSATADAAVPDVADFFQPTNGLLWSFVNTDLKPFLIHTKNGWQEQSWLGVGAGFSQAALQALTQAQRISSGLFSDGASQPSFSYQIYPEPTHGLSQIVFASNGQVYRYRNGPEEWHKLAWPGRAVEQSSYVSAVAAYGDNPATINSSGAWSLWHLLNKGKIGAAHGAACQITWRMLSKSQIYYVHMLLRSNRQANIFTELLLNKFSLPNDLFRPELAFLNGKN